MDMDMKMTAWWSFDQSLPFFSLTSVTLPALLTIVLMVLGGLAYILQVLEEGMKFIDMEVDIGQKVSQGSNCNEIKIFLRL